MMTSELYLNNAGTSFPKPEPVLRAVAETLQAQPSKYGAIYEESLATIAASLGANPARLLFTTSCTQALDVAILSLPWQKGDEILTSHLEHSSVIRPIETLGRLSGVTHQRVPYQAGQPFDLEFYERALNQGKTRLVIISAASNVTGEILPVREAADLAHAHGALLLVDAAQTFGLLDCTVESLAADLLTFAGHKNPLGTQGIGGLWAKQSVTFECNSAVCEVGEGGAPKAMPGYCDVGGVNLAGLASVAAGLQAWGSDREPRMKRAIALALNLAERARELPGVTVLGHHGGPQTATVSLVHAALPLEHAEKHFANQGIRVRAGTHCAPDALAAIGAREGTIRISFGPHNQEGDVEAALQALRAAG